MKIQDFVVLDLETTGLSVKEDQILEIGAVKVQGGEVTASYETFVNPGRKVPERITELTGIRDEMIANAPDVETAVRGFLDFCAVLVDRLPQKGAGRYSVGSQLIPDGDVHKVRALFFFSVAAFFLVSFPTLHADTHLFFRKFF